jgi:hypothetical protein
MPQLNPAIQLHDKSLAAATAARAPAYCHHAYRHCLTSVTITTPYTAQTAQQLLAMFCVLSACGLVGALLGWIIGPLPAQVKAAFWAVWASTGAPRTLVLLPFVLVQRVWQAAMGTVGLAGSIVRCASRARACGSRAPGGWLLPLAGRFSDLVRGRACSQGSLLAGVAQPGLTVCGGSRWWQSVGGVWMLGDQTVPAIQKTTKDLHGRRATIVIQAELILRCQSVPGAAVVLGRCLQW